MVAALSLPLRMRASRSSSPSSEPRRGGEEGDTRRVWAETPGLGWPGGVGHLPVIGSQKWLCVCFPSESFCHAVTQGVNLRRVPACASPTPPAPGPGATPACWKRGRPARGAVWVLTFVTAAAAQAASQAAQPDAQGERVLSLLEPGPSVQTHSRRWYKAVI